MTMLLLKQLKDFFEGSLSTLVAGRNYDKWHKKQYGLKRERIENKGLAKELEKVCQELGGVLTYSQYLEVEQFGRHGYHATQTNFGKTGVHARWVEPLVELCKKGEYSNVIEFGSGDGELGARLVKKAKSLGISIKWNGIEIQEALREKTRKKFEKHGITDCLQQLISSARDLVPQQKTLVVFSYSLDSIPPDIFVNTESARGSPNTLIGIKVTNGILSEVYLTKEDLRQKGLSFQNGIFKSGRGLKFDMSGWNLYQGQRAYIPIQAFVLLSNIAQKVSDDSSFLIIDEYSMLPNPLESNHLCLPKHLPRLRHGESIDIEKAYRQAGQRLLYYPTYLNTLISLLRSLGFKNIKYDIEEKLVEELVGNKWQEKRRGLVLHFCYGILASNRMGKMARVIKVEPPMSPKSV